jgi:hypothetical protein
MSPEELADWIADKVAARLQVQQLQLLTIEDLAERLAISVRSARTLIDGDPRRGIEPAIPSIRVGEGSRRVEASAVDAYVRSRQETD